MLRCNLSASLSESKIGLTWLSSLLKVLEATCSNIVSIYMNAIDASFRWILWCSGGIILIIPKYVNMEQMISMAKCGIQILVLWPKDVLQLFDVKVQSSQWPCRSNQGWLSMLVGKSEWDSFWTFPDGLLLCVCLHLLGETGFPSWWYLVVLPAHLQNVI